MTHLAPTLGNVQRYYPSKDAAFAADHKALSIPSTATAVTSTTLFNRSEPQRPLTDSFARELTYLRLSITDFCNFRCEYCLPDGYQGRPPEDELTVAEIATLVRGFAQVGTTKVRITGGEPSIRRDVVDIIKTIKQTPGIEMVAMTSNGYKLGKHLASWQAAGLNQINISMDSFEPDVFHKMTGFNMLPQLMADMDELLATTDIKLKINSILMAETAYENLINAIDYIKQRPVTYRFIEFMQTSDNSELFFAQHAQSELITNYLISHGWQPHARGHADGPAIEYSHPNYLGRIGMIAPYAAHFCDSCNRLRVSSQGKVHLCLFDQGNYDIREHLKGDDVEGLINTLHSFMPIKPEYHHLHDANSGMMHNLSMIGG
ncbi:GTP 3',8-cyclase MoaA [Psychrobacter sp. FBL11]|uniref:GTP 3',8-cyclase n=1 Tax=Psychrobacter saeujeotis TaxID=3143436 RepID=A0ABU9X982_9GAMM|nr:GTP 3',8-cyclase MoaA [uncultured Psychrobacter sp.]